MCDLLTRFNKEVLEQGADATLPINLNNEWLSILEQSLSAVLEYDDSTLQEEIDNYNMSIITMSIIHILKAKGANKNIKEVTISSEQFIKYLEDYRLEITIETMNRTTEIKIESATIETIFTNRQIAL